MARKKSIHNASQLRQSQQKTYKKPEVLSHESLERVAAGCSKSVFVFEDPDSCGETTLTS